MPNPQLHTEVAVATGATSATIIAGTLVGDVYLVIALAFLGGAISHIWVAKMNFFKMLVSIIGSSVLGVVMALLSTNLVIEAVGHFAPFLSKAVSTAEPGGKMLVAFLVAFLAQKAVPILFDWMDSKRGGNV